jgi:hypothetical protein
MDSFTVATMNSMVCCGARPLAFFQSVMHLQTSMSLIEATITKQLNLILLKRLTKSIAARLIFR